MRPKKSAGSPKRKNDKPFASDCIATHRRLPHTGVSEICIPHEKSLRRTLTKHRGMKFIESAIKNIESIDSYQMKHEKNDELYVYLVCK